LAAWEKLALLGLARKPIWLSHVGKVRPWPATAYSIHQQAVALFTKYAIDKLILAKLSRNQPCGFQIELQSI
jgi:hypothetical protein